LEEAVATPSRFCNVAHPGLRLELPLQSPSRRDHAVILTLLRLRLRAAEVAALTLDGTDRRRPIRM